MTKADLIKQLAVKLGVSQLAARRLLQENIQNLEQQLLENQLCSIPGLGTVAVKVSSERRQHIPGKEGQFIVPKRKRTEFKADRSAVIKLLQLRR